MSKRIVSFEVDTSELFDRLSEMGGDTGPLGARLVGAMLSEPGFGEIIGMSFYGVSLIDIPQPAKEIEG